MIDVTHRITIIGVSHFYPSSSYSYCTTSGINLSQDFSEMFCNVNFGLLLLLYALIFLLLVFLHSGSRAVSYLLSRLSVQPIDTSPILDSIPKEVNKEFLVFI